MSEHNLFYYPYASFTNTQLPLLKVAALWFDKLVVLDPVGASWDTVGADHVARDAVRLLKDAGILEVVTPATVLAKYEAPIAAAIRRDMADRQFLDLCDTQSQSSGKQRWTLSLAKVPQDLHTLPDHDPITEIRSTTTFVLTTNTNNEHGAPMQSRNGGARHQERKTNAKFMNYSHQQTNTKGDTK